MNLFRIRRALCAAALALPLLITAGCGDLYTRDDFTKAAMTRSEPEVQKQFGKPAEVDSQNPKRVVWVYRTTTFNIDKGNARDEKTLVIFEPDADGKLKVTGVEFG